MSIRPPCSDEYDSFPDEFILAYPETAEVQHITDYKCRLHESFDIPKTSIDTWFWSSFAKPIEGAKRVQHFHPTTQSSGKLPLLERLSTELVDGIIDILLTDVEIVDNKVAVLCPGLSSPVLCPKVLSRIHRDYERSPVPSLIGQNVGFHGALSHYANNQAAEYAKTNVLLDKNQVSWYNSVCNGTLWKSAARPGEYWHHAVSDLESHNVMPDMPAEQILAIKNDLRQIYMYPQTEPWSCAT
jgi:hypothetical protein